MRSIAGYGDTQEEQENVAQALHDNQFIKRCWQVVARLRLL